LADLVEATHLYPMQQDYAAERDRLRAALEKAAQGSSR